jgi:hypothetical protein
LWAENLRGGGACVTIHLPTDGVKGGTVGMVAENGNQMNKAPKENIA